MSNMAVTRHPPIRDQIADILRSAIVKLEFEPGQVLVERNLCEMTQASRPSVREALRQLEAEGLVESHNGRGTIVRVISAEEAAQVYEVRAELEGLAARLFTERATGDQRAALVLTTAVSSTAGTSASAIRNIARRKKVTRMPRPIVARFMLVRSPNAGRTRWSAAPAG